MIKTEYYRTREDGVNLYRTYSDANLMIRKVGTDEIYGEAIDVENSGFTYEETDEKIESVDTETTEGWYEVDAPVKSSGYTYEEINQPIKTDEVRE